jgi:hypothetical protein
MYKLPQGSEQNTKILDDFKKRNAIKLQRKGKENNPSNLPGKSILFDDPNLIEESRKEFAAEYLAKYGDADVERRAIPISDFPLPTNISDVGFNPAIYTNEYNCDTFNTILENYKQSKNDVNKLKLKTLLNDGDCLRMIDTIGKNKDDPINWNIPDGQFRPLLNELDISEPYNMNINNIIQTRKNAKTMPYRIRKLTAGKPKRKQRKTKRKQRTKRRRGINSRKK